MDQMDIDIKEKNINNTIIIMLSDVRTGGIAINAKKMIQSLLQYQKRVVWMHRASFTLDSEFVDIFRDNRVKEIEWATLEQTKQALAEITDSATMLSFSFPEFILSEYIKGLSKTGAIIDTTLWIQHYKDFFEDLFSRPLNKCLYTIIRKLYRRMDMNDNIFYTSVPHIEGYEKHYKYRASDPKKKVYSTCENATYTFSVENAKKRYRMSKRTIVGVGRFDFPHKGFIIGLIRKFGELREKYSNLELMIVGYGKDENNVLDEIAKLPIEYQCNVKLPGQIEYDRLSEIYKDAFVNVGVAATVGDGARNGVISLPVRQYSYSCETYGFLPESKAMTLSEEPGEDITPYIERILEMNEEEYIEMCRISCAAFPISASRVLDPFYLHNKTNKRIVPKWFLDGYLLYKRVMENHKFNINSLFQTHKAF